MSSRPISNAALAGLTALFATSLLAAAQSPSAVERLPRDVLDVAPPSSRVIGQPGAMHLAESGCRVPAAPLDAALRQRIVDVAVQEWAYFGFGIVDQSTVEPAPARGAAASPRSTTPRDRSRRGRPGRLPAAEAARVAASIAGYWTTTPEGAWIIDQQNGVWGGPAGIAARWESPWSAAFISWVMCASGLSDPDVFLRAVAHHRYIDQAIRARDGRAPGSAFVAYDAGEQPIGPGDLLCSGRRPAYLSLAERRRQMGQGATAHCDIVVRVDEARSRILAIGGNVRSAVSMKVLPAERDADGGLRPFDFSEIELDDNPYRGARPVFAHLKLRAPAIAADALGASPTLAALGCSAAGAPPARRAALEALVGSATCGS
ncbi:MAG: DUF2272 domain-containing protein [Vicinamibacterales bacterium]